jgi:hypothetical protein
MVYKGIARSFGLNITAAAAGLAGTFFITWFFGLAEFAYYTINFAKLSLILLGTELLPSSFTIFRLQEDERFTLSVPVFYVAFAVVAAAITVILLSQGWLAHASWFMVVFVITTSLQRYLDVQAQASGRVDAYFWIPATSNIVRVALLAGLAALKLMSVPDVLWASVAFAGLTGQVVMLSRFPEFLDLNAYRRPLGKFAYLWSIRKAYYAYYVNSVLKRVKDTFLPLFCDLVIPSKAEIGRFFVYTRANEAVCGQLRVLEAFMVNRSIRDDIQRARRRIFFFLAPTSQAMVALIALGLMYRHGIGPADVTLSIATGFFIYPYILELFWRNDALASFRPHQVTLSLLAFIFGLGLPPLIALALGRLGTPALVGGYVLGQTLSAATYRLFPPRALVRAEGVAGE